MTLIWPADSWPYWLATLAAVAGLALLVRRRAKAGAPGASRGRIAVGVLAAVAALVGLLPSAMFHALVTVLERPVSPDEALWWSGALVLLLAAAAVGTWALIGDRSRGRRRCGRCWYDMSATPGLQCPECGRTARSERRLYRTRRRWRWAILALVAVIGAAGLVVAPRVRDGSWPRYVPAVLVVGAMPHLSDGSTLQERLWYIVDDEPWQQGWRRGLLASRARASLHAEGRPQLVLVSLTILRPEEVDEHAAARIMTLADGTEGAHPQVRAQALSFAPILLPRPDEAVGPAVRSLDDPANAVRRGALNGLIVLGWTKGVAIDPPARVIEIAQSDPDPVSRFQALTSLGGMRTTAESLSVLITALDDPGPDVRIGALRAVARADPDRQRAAAMLLRLAQDPDPHVAGYAAEALAERGPHTEEALRAIGRVLDAADDDGAWRYGSGILMKLMQAPLPLETRLGMAQRAYANTWLRSAANNAVAMLGAELPEALAVLERQAASDTDGNDLGERWRRSAKRWIEDAMRHHADESSLDGGGGE